MLHCKDRTLTRPTIILMLVVIQAIRSVSSLENREKYSTVHELSNMNSEPRMFFNFDKRKKKLIKHAIG